MMATIPTYNTTNPNQWVPIGQETVKMAMSGMHIVGSTAGHPEMLWATFEHVSNAPNVAYQYINNSNVTVTSPQNISQGDDWLFCFKNAIAPFNDPHISLISNNIEPITPHSISQSNTLRNFPFGSNPSASSFNTDIISLNTSVRGMLASGDVRNKYFHAGTTWTIGGNPPNSGNQVGTNKLAASTMETYQIGSNCFSCHVTNTVIVSHIFNDLQPLF